MKIAVYLRKKTIESDKRYLRLIEDFEKAGCEIYRIHDYGTLLPSTDILIAVGGDGTFLSAAVIAGSKGIPMVGVNLGRLGFLSEVKPEIAVKSILSGDYTIEERTILHLSATNTRSDLRELSSESSKSVLQGFYPYALNEITVHRSGPAMLGVDVSIDGSPLPTYWADGLLVATSSGSTAYSLSVGGPILMPESKVLIISPIAPHNLNVRPLIVPDSSRVNLSLRARDEKVLVTADNRSVEVLPDVNFQISMARFSLRRLRLKNSNFIDALTSKLFWGEDIRNGTENYITR